MAKRYEVIITGSKGFIGTELRQRIADRQEYAYHALDDIFDEQQTAVLKSQNIDAIVHLAGVFSSDYSLLERINVRATQRLMELAVEAKVKTVIYVSTGAVYGDPEDESKSTEQDELRPNTLYGLTKLQAEEIIKYYCRTSGLKYLILRMPNVYGSAQKKGVIYNFLSQIKKDGVVTIHGDGRQRRNYLHVDDAIDAIELAIRYEGGSDIFNISNDTLISVQELVAFLKEKYTFDVRYVACENRLMTLNLDYEKSKAILGYAPKINVLKL